MALDTNQTVREIAIRYPGTVRVFESLGIDYCCGGERPLKEACESANVPLDQATAKLSAIARDKASAQQSSWTSRPLCELMQHIVTRHHAFVREEAPRLEVLLAKVVSRHGDAHPELRSIQEIFVALAQELGAHMIKEERILFPFLEEMEASGVIPGSCFGSVEFPISRMLADHEDAGALTVQIRALSANFEVPNDACPSYRAFYHGLAEFESDLHQHIHLENNILFPRAVEMEKRLAKATQVCP